MFGVFTFALLAASATAFPGIGGGSRRTGNGTRQRGNVPTVDGYPAWQAPRPGEVRSPCPGLNSVANHDICPRSGKGYTIPILVDCLRRGLNIREDFAVAIGTAGLASNPAPDLLNPYFDLDMLKRHNFVIEHDASLSRADVSAGNNVNFNQEIWSTVLAYFANQPNATIPVAAKAKFNRVKTEYARDPNFSYGPVQFILSYGETALYLSTMGDPSTGSAPVEWVRSLFEEERLPYAEGWRPTSQPTTLFSLGAMVLELNKANGEPVPEGLILADKSLKAVLIGLDPITGQIINPVLNALAKLTKAV